MSDFIPQDKCPRCGAKHVCVESPEECWWGFHGCSNCGLDWKGNEKPKFWERKVVGHYCTFVQGWKDDISQEDCQSCFPNNQEDGP